MQWRIEGRPERRVLGPSAFLGENPPADAVIQFHLKKPVTDLRFKITDATGREVRELTLPAERTWPAFRRSAGICARQPSAGWSRRRAAPAAPRRRRGGGGGGGAAAAAVARRPRRWLAGAGAPRAGCRRRCRHRQDPFNPCGGGGCVQPVVADSAAAAAATRPARLSRHLHRGDDDRRQGRRHPRRCACPPIRPCR